MKLKFITFRKKRENLENFPSSRMAALASEAFGRILVKFLTCSLFENFIPKNWVCKHSCWILRTYFLWSHYLPFWKIHLHLLANWFKLLFLCGSLHKWLQVCLIFLRCFICIDLSYSTLLTEQYNKLITLALVWISSYCSFVMLNTSISISFEANFFQVRLGMCYGPFLITTQSWKSFDVTNIFNLSFWWE